MHTILQHCKRLCLLAMLGFFSQNAFAQFGCPGCNVSLPVLPADTIFISPAADGVAGDTYDADISFRLPKTTTPVNATDPSTPAGLPISNIDIVAVLNVPPGLNWQASQLSFNPSNQTDGCVKFCGTPLLPGLYEVEVFITATVLTLNESTSFKFPIFIAPATSSNNGFSLTNGTGCGEVTVSFENNLPSGGDPGFGYSWDFGNGTTSTLENPAPVTYSNPGVYEVNYTASIDTFGYKITTVRVLDTGCDDAVFNVPPDLYVKIKDPQGNLLISTAVQDNVSFPAVFNINLPLGDGTYELEVRDEDTFGSESCGYVYFTKTNTAVLTSGELEVQVDIIHPVQAVQSSAVVRVFAQPAAPVVMPDGVIDLCVGEAVELVADLDQNIQWYRDTAVILGEIYQNLNVTNAGEYWLEYTSADGCKSQSEVVTVNYVASPNTPSFTNIGNEYMVADPSQLPTDYSLQWYLDGNLLTDETGLSYCLMQPGVFLLALEVTDNLTGCTNEFSLGVSFDTDYTCAISATDETASAEQSLLVFPNPTAGDVMLDFRMKNPGRASLQIFDALGKLAHSQALQATETQVKQPLDLGHLPAGAYFIKLQTADGVLTGRVVRE